MRSAVTVKNVSTDLYRAQLQPAQGNQLSVTVQNPATNTSNIEIAWDDVTNPLVSGTGYIIPPGQGVTIRPLPSTALGVVGVLAISPDGSDVPVRVQVSSTIGGL